MANPSKSKSRSSALKIGEDKPIGELNVKPSTIFIKDNLEVMRGMESGTIDLIATDPPFNKKKTFEAPIGSDAEGSSFSDKWTYDEINDSWVQNMEQEHPEAWNLVKMILAIGDKSLASFMIYMHTRALEMHRILKPTGSLYWHCDQEAGHYLKIMLDIIFGKENFRNDIIWHYENKLRDKRKKIWQNAADSILYYTKSNEYTFNPPYEQLDQPKKYTKMKKVDGKKVNVKDEDGKVVYMETTQKLMDNVIRIGMLTSGKERTGYATQKPLKLYQKIIETSSNIGDIVLDPFCGCATTCVAAELLQRQWIGIDVSKQAYNLVKQRLASSSIALDTHKTIMREDLPVRKTDIVKTPKAELRKILYLLQDGKCNHCGISCTLEQMPSFFDLDHIVPSDKGGHDGDSNRQLLCRSCNVKKGNKDDATAKARLQKLEKELGLVR